MLRAREKKVNIYVLYVSAMSSSALQFQKQQSVLWLSQRHSRSFKTRNLWKGVKSGEWEIKYM